MEGALTGGERRGGEGGREEGKRYEIGMIANIYEGMIGGEVE